MEDPKITVLIKIMFRTSSEAMKATQLCNIKIKNYKIDLLGQWKTRWFQSGHVRLITEAIVLIAFHTLKYCN